MISLAPGRLPYTDDNVSSQAAREAQLTGIGGSVETYDIVLASVVLTLAIGLVLVALSYGWQPLCSLCLKKNPHRVTKISHAYEELSQACS